MRIEQQIHEPEPPKRAAASPSSSGSGSGVVNFPLATPIRTPTGGGMDRDKARCRLAVAGNDDFAFRSALNGFYQTGEVRFGIQHVYSGHRQ